MKSGREEAVEFLAEFAGTFWLVLLGAGAIMKTTGAGAPDRMVVALSFGFAVATAVICLSRVSGAHLNPAVTLALALAGRFGRRRVLLYVVAQMAGAVAAAAVLRVTLGSVAALGATVPTVSDGVALAAEASLTAVLVSVVLVVVARPRIPVLFAGIIIGGAVAAGAWFAGGLSGASMNPARSLGPALVSGELGALWIYLVGPALGAIVGALGWRVAVGRGVLHRSGGVALRLRLGSAERVVLVEEGLDGVAMRVQRLGPAVKARVSEVRE